MRVKLFKVTILLPPDEIDKVASDASIISINLSCFRLELAMNKLHLSVQLS